MMKSGFKAFIDRVFPTLFSKLAVIVLVCLPLAYSVLYLWAFWDPYNKMSNLPVAFVNLDKGGTKDGEYKNVGSQLQDELKTNDNLKWEFTTLQDAQVGLLNKKYYSYLIVPENFTQNVLSVDQENPQKATVYLRTRQASNVISATIVNRVTYAVTQELGHKVSEEYIDNIFVQTKDTVQDLQKAVNGAQDLNKGLSDAKSGSRDLTEGLEDAYSGGQDLYNGVYTAADGSETIQSGLHSAYKSTGTLQSGLGSLYDGAVTIRDNLAAASAGAQTLNAGSTTAYQGAAALSAYLQQAVAGSTQISTKLAEADSAANQISGGLASFAQNLPALQQGLTAAGQAAGAVAGQAQAIGTTSSSFNASIQSLLAAHSELATDSDVLALQSEASDLAAQSGTLTSASGTLSGTMQQVSSGFSSGTSNLPAVISGAASLSSGLDTLSAGSGGLTTQLGQIQNGAQSLTTGLNSAVAGSTKLAKGLTDLSAGSVTLAKNLNEAYTGSGKLSAGLKALDSGSEDLTDGLYSLRSGSKDMVDGLSDLKDGSQKLDSGLATASSGSQELYEKLNDGYTKAKDQVTDAKIAREKPIISNPVDMSEEITDPVATYGTGFTPYFVPLALWVGSMAIFFVLQPLSNKDAGRMSRLGLLKEIVMRYGVFALIVTLQAILQDAVLIKALGLHPNHPQLFFLFTILLGLLDVAIIECLVFLLDRGGIFIAVILLMLQLTSSAGAFPRETMPAFFNTIAPYLPMTYAVNELRDIISGSTVNIGSIAAAFACAIAVFLLITFIFKRMSAQMSLRESGPLLNHANRLKTQFAFSGPAASFSSATFQSRTRRFHPAQSFNNRLQTLRDKRKAGLKAMKIRLQAGTQPIRRHFNKPDHRDEMKQ
jgi:putative membrane protein